MQSTTRNKEPDARIYFPELDGLRFFAFLLVFIHHQTLFTGIPFFQRLQDFGWIGVDIFFVLSAYLLTKLLVTEHERTGRISFKKFYLRRIFRIWPIYYLLVGFGALYYIYVVHASFITEPTLRLLGLISFTDNIMSAVSGYNPLPFVSHLWTIGYEEQFYVFIPFIILLMVRASYQARLMSAITMLFVFNLIRVWMIYKQAPHPAIWVLPLTHFESIMLGIIIGVGGLDFLLRKLKAGILFTAGLLLFVLLCQLPFISNTSYWLVLSYLLTGASTALVLYAVLKGGGLQHFFSKPIFVFLGKRSYGLYIYHLMCNGFADIAVIKFKWLPSGQPFIFIYSLLLTILVSAISYRLVETPFLLLKKRFEVIVTRPV